VCNFGSLQRVRKVAKLLCADLPNTRDEVLAPYAKEHKFISAPRDYHKAPKRARPYGAAWWKSGYREEVRIYASWC
jgi:hypothetical protein